MAFYTVRQAMREFGLSERTIRWAISTGKIPTRIVGREDLESQGIGIPLRVAAVSTSDCLKLKSAEKK